LRQRVKAELRKRMRGLRAALPASACEERSRRIVARLELCESVARAKSVALFWPMLDRHEVDLRPLASRLRAKGVSVALPSTDDEATSMTLRCMSDAALREDPLGFQAPGPECPVATEVDVIVVPAIAVDPRGHRLGYGAGYYDRFLPLVAPPAVAIAVAFDFQLIAEVPILAWDVAVSSVVTDARTIECDREADSG
jgi:5-formyltetrahydrofolate cyclo-ligase